MKLLILVNNPDRASFRLRAANFLDYFQQEGIDCQVCKLPQNNIHRWRLFKSAHKYDAILLHRKCLNFIDARILARYSRKIIFDHDDAIMYSTSKPESNHTSHFRLYKRTIQRCDSVIAGNNYLAEHAQRFCHNVHVIPTGLDVTNYLPNKNILKSVLLRLVWIGSESTLPYLEELKPVLEEIGQKRDRIVLRIIADKFFKLKNMPVEKCEWSLQNQATDLNNCDIGLSPLPDNRFSRGKCGFKILQYFATGLPVIASPVGVNEKFISESGAGLLATTPQEWKKAVETLVNDPNMCRQMGQNGLQYAQDYNISVVAKKFCQIIKE